MDRPLPDPAPALRGLDSVYREVGGHRLHAWLGGPADGPAVVLVHGFLGTGFTWREVAPRLVDAGRRVLVVDLLGYGDSAKPPGVEGYDAAALADLLRDLAADLGLATPLTLVGHDMGAPALLLWAAAHPDEVTGVVYADEPTLLGDELRRIIAFTPEAMAAGSMWWWILPLAPGVPEALLVRNERAFLEWFYAGPAGAPDRFGPDVVDEVLRTFAGTEGVLGALGVYRAAFTSIDQTEALLTRPLTRPVVAVGGEHGLGAEVARMLRRVATDVTEVVLPGCGHFVVDQAPDQLTRIVLDLPTEVPHHPPREAPS